MNPVIYVALAALLAAAFYIGKILWEKWTDTDSYYFGILFCGVATGALTFLMVTLTLLSGTEGSFDTIVGINFVQSIVSLGLLLILHKKVKWEEMRRMLRVDRKYIGYAALFFVGGLIIGSTAQDEIREMLEGQLEDLDDMVGLSEDRPLWQIGIFIFGNNTKTAILLGLMLPIIPLLGGIYIIFAMVLNGAIVGVVGAILDKPLTYFIAGIVPHGIFEIPAILIAAAIGLKFNSKIIFGILAAFSKKDEDATTVLRKYITEGIESWKLIYLVLLLLTIAAIIESTLTPALLKLF